MSKSILNLPDIISYNHEIYDFRDSKILVFPVVLDTYESHSDKVNEIIKDKLEKNLTGKCTRYGYIVKILKIIKIGIGVIENYSFDCSVTYSVWVEANVFNPTYGKILTGNKIVSVKDTGDIYLVNLNSGKEFTIPSGEKKMKYETRMLVIGATVPSKDMYKHGDIVAVHIIGAQYNLGSPMINISGVIMNVYDMPFNLRYISFDNKDKRGYNLDLKMGLEGAKVSSAYGNEYLNTEKLIKYVRKKTFLGRSWDETLRLAFNPYELIKTSKGYYKDYSKYFGEYTSFKIKEDPVSRAYFKMIEILRIFFRRTDLNKKKVFTIGDAPGGFAQAINHIYPKASIITTSLNLGSKEKNDKNEVPNYQPVIDKNPNISIDYMKKGNGDITDIDNVLNFLESLKGKKMYFVAGDAAIDFDAYPDKPKEIIHVQLFVTEVIIGLLTQEKHGGACYKLYTQMSPVTVSILYWLSGFYDRFNIYKPMSSRIANTETFVICAGFKGLDNKDEKNLIELLSKMKPQRKYTNLIESFISDKIPYDFQLKIENYNKNLMRVRKFIYEYALDIISNVEKKGTKFDRQVYLKEQEKFILKFIKIMNGS